MVVSAQVVCTLINWLESFYHAIGHSESLSGKRWVTQSIPDWRTLLVTAPNSVLISQAGCNGRVISPPFFSVLRLARASRLSYGSYMVTGCLMQSITMSMLHLAGLAGVLRWFATFLRCPGYLKMLLENQQCQLNERSEPLSLSTFTCACACVCVCVWVCGGGGGNMSRGLPAPDNPSQLAAGTMHSLLTSQCACCKDDRQGQ